MNTIINRKPEILSTWILNLHVRYLLTKNEFKYSKILITFLYGNYFEFNLILSVLIINPSQI